MKRVEVTRCWTGLCSMQVCAIPDATDEEILEICNKENPSGTEAGWGKVIREIEDVLGENKGMLPGPCKDFPGRIHYLVFC